MFYYAYIDYDGNVSFTLQACIRSWSLHILSHLSILARPPVNVLTSALVDAVGALPNLPDKAALLNSLSNDDPEVWSQRLFSLTKEALDAVFDKIALQEPSPLVAGDPGMLMMFRNLYARRCAFVELEAQRAKQDVTRSKLDVLASAAALQPYQTQREKRQREKRQREQELEKQQLVKQVQQLEQDLKTAHRKTKQAELVNTQLSNQLNKGGSEVPNRYIRQIELALRAALRIVAAVKEGCDITDMPWGAMLRDMGCDENVCAEIDARTTEAMTMEVGSSMYNANALIVQAVLEAVHEARQGVKRLKRGA